jgi:hypothetical protein
MQGSRSRWKEWKHIKLRIIFSLLVPQRPSLCGIKMRYHLINFFEFEGEKPL